ncbi:bifunctional (p)ppGpp synthetase/guanosine-3',5'-bis(diphosphate) 3'-pyrophosphohydrolase, partial [Candidatus Wolfebacteria bacterium]|nr:bifunctional (p)ppGpp synthetase/guanosine-3',5'-bis(diphosphate) 3'-pyrophosphohydrolase [Candidatus Wolfebacteria bacterium]
GDECVGAKINGKISPLDYQLQSGDMVEILTQKSKRPSESWLRFAKTDQAKRKIKSGLKKSNSFTQKKSVRTEFRIVISDRIGILKDITAVVSRSRINIINVNLIKTGGFPNIKMVCELSDKRKIESLVFKLKKVKEVREINYKSV